MYNSLGLGKMRVIGGAAKGRRLQGSANPQARPTSELVRGAIFNILGDVEGVLILDLFAGTGALGIEALSRGAKWADFVEHNLRQCDVIRANLVATKFVDMAQVHTMSVQSAFKTLRGPYDLVLMDPPYNLESLYPVLEGLGQAPLLGESALVVVGHSKRQPVEKSYGPLIHDSSHRYGDSLVELFRRGSR